MGNPEYTIVHQEIISDNRDKPLHAFYRAAQIEGLYPLRLVPRSKYKVHSEKAVKVNGHGQVQGRYGTLKVTVDNETTSRKLHQLLQEVSQTDLWVLLHLSMHGEASILLEYYKKEYDQVNEQLSRFSYLLRKNLYPLRWHISGQEINREFLGEIYLRAVKIKLHRLSQEQTPGFKPWYLFSNNTVFDMEPDPAPLTQLREDRLTSSPYPQGLVKVEELGLNSLLVKLGTKPLTAEKMRKALGKTIKRLQQENPEIMPSL